MLNEKSRQLAIAIGIAIAIENAGTLVEVDS